MINEINKIERHWMYVVVALILLMILPPYLFLFEFRPKLFLSFALVEKVFMSLAITTPIYTLSSLILTPVLPKNPPDALKTLNFYTPALSLIPTFYIPCATSFFVSIDFNTAVYVAIGSYVIGLIILIYDITH